MLTNSKQRNKGRNTGLLIVLALMTSILALSGLAAANSKDSSSSHDWPQVTEPVNLAILIQDDLVGNVSNEMKLTKSFIKSLPQGSQVMVGYITTGTLQVRQPFTGDLDKAANSLRMVISSPSASAFNPYVEVLEGLKRFDSNNKNSNKNALLLISDGLDVSRGFDVSSVLHSIDLERAIKEANKRNIPIYSFYAPSTGLTRWNRVAASYGQSSLNRISNETGGKAFFEGSTGFVTFDPHFKRLAKALNEQETVTRQSARSE